MPSSAQDATTHPMAAAKFATLPNLRQWWKRAWTSVTSTDGLAERGRDGERPDSLSDD